MPTLPDDQWPADDPLLASFAEDLRIVAGGPAPEPRPGLVAVMRQGPSGPSSGVAGPVQSEPSPGRKKMLVKSMLGGLAAKVALGVGVAAASVTAAGAAGVLPAPAQDVVASVVSATTPFQLPTSSDVTSLVADQLGSTTTSSTTVTTLAGSKTGDDNEAVNEDNAGTDRAVNHGACVSTAAKDKTNDDGNHGKTVSSIARSDCGKDATAGSSTTTSSTTSTTSLSSSTARSNNSGPGSANSGKGNSGNAGNGNGNDKSGSGKGGSGNSGRD